MEDESEFVSWVSSLVDHDANLLGHREDAVAVRAGDKYMVINIDGWVESTDRPSGMTGIQCGYRAVFNAASDVLVKGAAPEAMVISMSSALRHENEIQDIIRGFSAAAKELDIAYLGGDMNSSTDLVIDVTIWGRTDRLIRRSTAEVGQSICWLGPPLGKMTVALGILLGNLRGDKEEALEVFTKPRLFPDFLDLDAKSSVDCSDGLARSLHLLAENSSVKLELDQLEITDPWSLEVLERNSFLDHNEAVLYGGEELGIVFTCEPESDLPKEVVMLGKVREGSGVYLGESRIDNKGWDHFSD